MSTAKKIRPESNSGKSPKSGRPAEAIALLKADHKLVEELFEKYEKARSASVKKQLVEQICTELTIHAQIEEEIFYPEVKQALKDHELVPEAEVEHETLKALIEQLQTERMEDDTETYDAKVKVLGEYVKHHVKEEQNELFPKVRESKLDLQEMGEQLQQRKEELMSAVKPSVQ